MAHCPSPSWYLPVIIPGAVWRGVHAYASAVLQALHAIFGLPSIRLGVCRPVADTELQVHDEDDDAGGSEHKSARGSGDRARPREQESKHGDVRDACGASRAEAGAVSPTSIASEVAEELDALRLSPAQSADAAMSAATHDAVPGRTQRRFAHK